MRRLFNNGPYLQMIADGDVVRDSQYLRNDHLRHPETVNEPWCTNGQKIRYLGPDGRWLFVVFQYLRPDATIGASGRPDPKRLHLGDGIIIVDTELPREAR